jgi:hypothetical protein
LSMGGSILMNAEELGLVDLLSPTLDEEEAPKLGLWFRRRCDGDTYRPCEDGAH